MYIQEMFVKPTKVREKANEQHAAYAHHLCKHYNCISMWVHIWDKCITLSHPGRSVPLHHPLSYDHHRR